MSLPSPARGYRLIALVSVLVAFLVASADSPAAPQTVRADPAAEAAPVEWEWPVLGPRRIITRYLAPPTPYAAGHRGIDIAAPPGIDVHAPEDGIVHFAGVVVDRPVLSLRHAGGLISSVEPVDSTLVAGDAVSRGQVVGMATGTSTHCGSPCIHFGVRLHGEYVSPLNYLGGIERSVLLPTRSIG